MRTVEGAGKVKVKPPEAQKSSAEKTRLMLEYLTGPAPKAQKAYKVLWGIDKKQIPSLVAHVGDNVRTKIRELDLLVLQQALLPHRHKQLLRLGAPRERRRHHRSQLNNQFCHHRLLVVRISNKLSLKVETMHRPNKIRSRFSR
jgi:hypothetical protein